MNYYVAIDNLVKNKRWVRNDIGLGKVQYLKLISENEKLKILILSNVLPGPLYTNVDNIVVMSDQITVFYDGEHYETLKEGEYEDFKENITKEEWNTLFHGDVTKDLDELGLVEKEKGFIAQAHDDIQHINTASVNMEISEEICRTYGIR